MLYKLINNRPAPFNGRYIRHDGNICANPTDEQLRTAGWKPLNLADKPEDAEGYYWTDTYEETEAAINQAWEKCEIIDGTEV